MERIAITPDLVNAIDAKANSDFWTAILAGFTSRLEQRGIGLARTDAESDLSAQCKLTEKDRMEAGRSLMWAKIAYLAPQATRDRRVLWLDRWMQDGEWMGYVNSIESALEAQGFTFVVVDQAKRDALLDLENGKLAMPAEPDDLVFAPGKPSLTTLRGLIQQAIEQNAESIHEAAIAVCKVLESQIGLSGNGWWDDDPELQKILEA